jgi:hypothetical protein
MHYPLFAMTTLSYMHQAKVPLVKKRSTEVSGVGLPRVIVTATAGKYATGTTGNKTS